MPLTMKLTIVAAAATNAKVANGVGTTSVRSSAGDEQTCSHTPAAVSDVKRSLLYVTAARTHAKERYGGQRSKDHG